MKRVEVSSGLAVTLAEACLRRAVGFTSDRVRIRGRRDAALFGEQASRVVVSVAENKVAALEALLGRIEVPFVRIGVTGGDRLTLAGAIDSATIIIPCAATPVIMMYPISRNEAGSSICQWNTPTAELITRPTTPL